MFNASFDGAIVPIPLARVELGRGGSWSPPVDAMIDTGAICSVISITSSLLLGLSEAQVRSGPSVVLGGVGGSSTQAYRWQCDFRFDLATMWKDMQVYVFDGPVPYPVLIGQRSALDGRALAHIKIKTPNYFTIR